MVLFGSYARGDASKHSDLDLLVIEPEVRDAIDESVRLRRTLRGLGLFADVIVVSETEVGESAAVQNTLIHDALSEGRALTV